MSTPHERQSTHDETPPEGEFTRDPEIIIANLPLPLIALAFSDATKPLKADYDIWFKTVLSIRSDLKRVPKQLVNVTVRSSFGHPPRIPEVTRLLYDLGEANALIQTLSIRHPSVLEVNEHGKVLIDRHHGSLRLDYGREIALASHKLVQNLALKPEDFMHRS